MRCKKFKQDIILDLYAELGGPEKAGLERHLESCAECRRDREHSRRVLAVLDESRRTVPETDWQRQWEAVSACLRLRKAHWRLSFALPRWAMAAAGLLVVFILGITAGRIWLPIGRKPIPGKPLMAETYSPALSIFLNDIKPLIVEYSNTIPDGAEDETIALDRTFVRSLLIQNILLRRIVADRNPEAVQLLEDIDLVLHELDNLQPGDPQATSLIREIIEKRDILFKMEVMQKT